MYRADYARGGDARGQAACEPTAATPPRAGNERGVRGNQVSPYPRPEDLGGRRPRGHAGRLRAATPTREFASGIDVPSHHINPIDAPAHRGYATPAAGKQEARAWARGPPARIRKARGNRVSPLAASPRWGGGARFPPQAGAGEGGGGLRRRALPAQTLPPGERTGKPGFPLPLLESQALPRAGAWGNQGSPYPCLRARPSRGRGRGETRVPPIPA